MLKRNVYVWLTLASAAVLPLMGNAIEEFDATTETANTGATLEDRVKTLEDQYVALAEHVMPKEDPKDSGEDDEAAIAKGKQLFMQNCAKCHGKNGEGDGPFARAIHNIKDLRSPSMKEVSDQTIYDTITNGKPPMPSFGSSLTEQDRHDLVKYVRTLTPGDKE